MCAKSDQFGQPDNVLSRLIAEALQAGGPDPVVSPCPDTEQIAAYADQGVRSALRDDLERHFAACGRCQNILASLGQELHVPPETTSVPEVSPRAERLAPHPGPRRPWLWWLAPAFATAAAALLWIILRPAPSPPVQTAASYTAETSPSVAPAPPDSSRQRNEGASRSARNLDALAANSASAEKGAAANQIRQNVTAPVESSAQIATLSAETSPAAVGAPSAAPIAPAAPSADQLTAIPAQGAAPAARLSGPAATEQSSLQLRAAAANADIAAQQAGSAAPDNAERLQIVLYTFSPPDGTVTWKIGSSGLIEISTDKGQSRQRQISGVNADLVAGSASAKDAAWVVGRGGIILRTTDGQHWEQVPPPAGVNSEWVAVAAHDALNATVIAQDLRRFTTADGGRTWIQQQ